MSQKQLKHRSRNANLKPAQAHSNALDQTTQQLSRPGQIVQRMRTNNFSLSSREILQLQRTIGNRAVTKLIQRPARKNPTSTVQRDVLVNYGNGDIRKFNRKGQAEELKAFFDNIDDVQLGHAGYAALSDKQKSSIIGTLLNNRKSKFKFELIENPKTHRGERTASEIDEDYLWRITTPTKSNYFIYSYEGWRVIFDELFPEREDSDDASKTVTLIWSCDARTKSKVQAYSKLEERLLEPTNYDHVTGQPGFNNSHIDDTKIAQWKLQADVVDMGKGSVDRLHIDVEVDGDSINVTVVDLSLNTH